MDYEEIILLLVYLTQDKLNTNLLENQPINDYIKSMDIKPEYTREKIRLASKILPYIPEELLEAYIRSLKITENFITIIELRDGVINSDQSTIGSIDFRNNTDRLNTIISVVREELNKSNIESLGMVLFLISNMDNYYSLIELIGKTMENTKGINSTESGDELASLFTSPANRAERLASDDIEKLIEIMDILKKYQSGNKENNPNQKL